MIVTDTNVIGYLFLSSDKSRLSELALRKDSEWAAPVLWRSELRNVLASYMHKAIIALHEAQQIMDRALALMRGREFEVSSGEILKLVSESKCSAYDCEFIAVARDLGVPLVTVDKQLLREFPDSAISLGAYCS